MQGRFACRRGRTALGLLPAAFIVTGLLLHLRRRTRKRVADRAWRAHETKRQEEATEAAGP